jgi:fatty acid desaturase
VPATTIDSAATGTDHDGYRALRRQVRAAGLLAPRPWSYAARISATVLASAAGWGALFVVGNSPAALAVAALLALVFAQTVFLGHDAGHQQICATPHGNWLVGLGVGNLLTGMSFGWWVPKHNAHHAHPNQVDRDPDIGPGVVAFTQEIARGRRGAARWLAREQAWLFFPLLLLEAVSLQISSIQNLRGRRDSSARLEAVLLVGHAAAYLGVIFWLLSPLRALAFIAINQGLFGLYLGCSFAPNHKGMPILDHGSSLSFARRQVITARNVVGGRFTTFMLGGLNYQIEHHLFPTMPRPNLARAQPIIEAYCAEHELSYRQDSLVGSYRQTWRHLRQVGARAPQPSRQPEDERGPVPQPVDVRDDALAAVIAHGAAAPSGITASIGHLGG